MLGASALICPHSLVEVVLHRAVQLLGRHRVGVDARPRSRRARRCSWRCRPWRRGPCTSGRAGSASWWAPARGRCGTSRPSSPTSTARRCRCRRRSSTGPPGRPASARRARGPPRASSGGSARGPCSRGARRCRRRRCPTCRRPGPSGRSGPPPGVVMYLTFAVMLLGLQPRLEAAGGVVALPRVEVERAAHGRQRAGAPGRGGGRRRCRCRWRGRRPRAAPRWRRRPSEPRKRLRSIRNLQVPLTCVLAHVSPSDGWTRPPVMVRWHDNLSSERASQCNGPASLPHPPQACSR